MYTNDLVLLAPERKILQEMIDFCFTVKPGTAVYFQKNKSVGIPEKWEVSKEIEKWNMEGKRLEIVNSYNYHGYILLELDLFQQDCLEWNSTN